MGKKEDIQEIPKEDTEKLKKLHHLLCKWLKKICTMSDKRHGNYWDGEIELYPGNVIRYRLDDYSSACYAYSGTGSVYFGIDFGGFTSHVNEFAYKWHIGTVYQYWLRNKK